MISFLHSILILAGIFGWFRRVRGLTLQPGIGIDRVPAAPLEREFVVNILHGDVLAGSIGEILQHRLASGQRGPGGDLKRIRSAREGRTRPPTRKAATQAALRNCSCQLAIIGTITTSTRCAACHTGKTDRRKRASHPGLSRRYEARQPPCRAVVKNRQPTRDYDASSKCKPKFICGFHCDSPLK